MATNTIVNPSPAAGSDYTAYGTDSAASELIGYNSSTGTASGFCKRKVGHMVFQSARVQIPSAVGSGAMSIPLVKLGGEGYYPKEGTAGLCPSTVVIKSGSTTNIFAGLVSIAKTNGAWYAYQQVASSLAAGTIIELFFVYETD